MEENIKKDVLNQCICEGCPTWKDCGKGEKGFCILGKSKCIKDENGCICPGCPFHKKMSFKEIYYCTKGTEKEQQ